MKTRMKRRCGGYVRIKKPIPEEWCESCDRTGCPIFQDIQRKKKEREDLEEAKRLFEKLSLGDEDDV